MATYTDIFTFLSSASAATTGNELDNVNNYTLVVSVEGTFVGSITMEGYLGNVWHTLAVVDIAGIETASAITAAGAYAVVCPVAFSKIRANLTSISSGSVTVIGKIYGGEGIETE